MLAQAQKDLEAGQVKRAALALPKLTAFWYPKKFVEDRKKLSVVIERKSEDALEAADALNSDGKLAEAALAYERIKRQYPVDLPVVPKATKKQKDLLERNKDLQLEFAKLKKNEEVVETLDEARRLAEDSATVSKAKMLYRSVILAQGDGPLANQAKEELEKLEAGGPVAKADPKDKTAKRPDTRPSDANKPVIPKPNDKGEAPVILLPDK
jgi:tetratricopeptide (TPR) repeat protein